MAERIYLQNDWDIHRTDITSRGVLQSGLFPRGFISLTQNGATIHASLEIVLTELSAGDYIGTIQGTALTAQLLSLWTAAQAAGTKLVVYERVVVDTEDYGDYVALTVERDRPARRG